MRGEPVAIAALTVIASTMGAMAWSAWGLQGHHRQALQCVRPGMTAAQVRTVLGRPRTEWYHEEPLRAVLAAAFEAELAGSWALAMPTTPCVAPPVEDAERYLTVLSRTAIPWSFTGLPAVSVPCGTSPEGLPIGLQLVAGRGREHYLVALAALVERIR